MNYLQAIRRNWHPLWTLRKSSAFRFLQDKYDFTTFISVPGIRNKLAIKFLRDLSWIVTPTAVEPEIRQAFDLILTLTKPAIFWDIGANVGIYSWLVRQYPSVKNVVLFEPDPVNCSLIKKTLQRSKIQHCELLNVAVADKVGQSHFVVDSVSGATGSLEDTFAGDNPSSLHSHYAMGSTIITCDTVTVDHCTNGRPLPDFLKIDVEGAEHLVIAGAMNYITAYKPTIVMESNNLDLVNSMRSLGYTIFRIDSGNFLFVKNDLGAAIRQLDTHMVRH